MRPHRPHLPSEPNRYLCLFVQLSSFLINSPQLVKLKKTTAIINQTAPWHVYISAYTLSTLSPGTTTESIFSRSWYRQLGNLEFQ